MTEPEYDHGDGEALEVEPPLTPEEEETLPPDQEVS